MQPSRGPMRRLGAMHTIRHFLETNNKLKKQFATPDPQLVQIPDISFHPNPAIPMVSRTVEAGNGERVRARFVTAITRPKIVDEIVGHLQRCFKQQQAASSIDEIGVFQYNSPNCMASGMFLRGCKGIGKSYLLLQTAIKLLLHKPRRTKVVYIGDCNAWVQCADDTQRRLFLARALQHAFFDDERLLDVVSSWRRRVIDESAGHPYLDINTLLSDINSHCQQAGLNVAFLVDKADALIGSNSSSVSGIYNRDCEELLSQLLLIQRTPCFALLLAASDDEKAGAVCSKLYAGSIPIQPLFSSSEAIEFVRSHPFAESADIWLIKELVNRTWRHPQQLMRLCNRLERTYGKQIGSYHAHDILGFVARIAEEPFLDFKPSPFALTRLPSQMDPDSTSRSVRSILSMKGALHSPVDANYMSLVTAENRPIYIFPSPQIAKGLVEYCCGSSNDIETVEEQLSRMRTTIYQTFG